MLFRDGTITAKGAPFVSELREQLTNLEAPLLINEDVHGSWSRSSVRGRRGGRIDVSSRDPDRRPHVGAHRANRCAQPWPGARRSFAAERARRHHADLARSVPGTRISSVVAGLGLIDIFLETACPPPPFSRIGVESLIVFAQKGSGASDAAPGSLPMSMKEAITTVTLS